MSRNKQAATRFGEVTIPAVSAAGESVIVMDAADSRLKVSENGSAFKALSGGGSTNFGGIYRSGLGSTVASVVGDWVEVPNANTLDTLGSSEFERTADNKGIKYTGAGGNFLVMSAITLQPGSTDVHLAQVSINGNHAGDSLRMTGSLKPTAFGDAETIAIPPAFVALATNDELRWFFQQVTGISSNCVFSYSSTMLLEV